ncbi:DUF4158 domain-containing protein [Nonomuraea jabiensis]|uniref:DUF4158 domain-containing protein n=1 Tax=Nonomuraea jabiensis TaxID=882448 RepID=UPI003D757790
MGGDEGCQDGRGRGPGSNRGKYHEPVSDLLLFGFLGRLTIFAAYPDIGREGLIRFFTLTRKDLGFIDNLDRGGGRGAAARLGLAVQLCTLPWLGFVPDGIWAVPQAAVLGLANQLAAVPAGPPCPWRR